MARVNGKAVAAAAGGMGLLFLLMGRKADASTSPGLTGTRVPPVGPPEPQPEPGGLSLGPQGGTPEDPDEPPGQAPLGFDTTPGVGPVNPADIIGPWLSDVPMGRRFYTVKQGNTLRGVARQALGVNLGHPGVLAAQKCITGVQWNLSLYGTPCDPMREPCFDSVPVDGEASEWDIRQAFLPSHVNAVAAMFDGTMPERAIGYDARSEGVYTGNYGTIWIPAMSYNDETGEVICDGDIPPAVSALLQFP